MLSELMTREINENYQVSLRKSTQTGSPLREAWKSQEGVSHNPNGPAVQIWDERTGELTYEVWRNKKGQEHRDGDKPAVIKRDPRTKVVTEEMYFINGVEHRRSQNEPTRIKRDEVTGKVRHIEWQRQGKYHRDNGLPAVVSRDPRTNIITYEAYYTHGKCSKEIQRDPATGKACGNENIPTPEPVKKALRRDFNM
jgi:hypothetical protein